jgi:hypothetical protein
VGMKQFWWQRKRKGSGNSVCYTCEDRMMWYSSFEGCEEAIPLLVQM